MPPSHFLASIDTAAVQPDQLTQTSGTKAKKETNVSYELVRSCFYEM